MNEFGRLPLESLRSWMDRLTRIESACLPREQQRMHLHCLAEVRRLLEEEQQQARWNRRK